LPEIIMPAETSPSAEDRARMFADVAARALAGLNFRGKNRLLGLLCPATGRFTARRFGCRLHFDVADLIQRQFFLGTYEPSETAQVRRILRSGMTFCDVGANVGWFALQAAGIVGESGRVLAFEPGDRAYRQLAAAVADNGLRQVTVFRAGLSDQPGRMDLYEPVRPGNYTPTMVPNEGGAPVSVAVLRLDDVLEEQGVGTVDLVKIDVEGHEFRVLSGAERALSNGRIRAVLCEFNPDWLTRSGSSPAALQSLLENHGFREWRPTGVPDRREGGDTRLFLHRDSLDGRA
jgi:FkbM family methyltransferase